MRIAADGAVHGGFGESGLDGQHGLGFGSGNFGLVARQLKHLLHVVQVFLTRLDRLGVVLDVVIAIGQSETALIEVSDGLARIVHVGHLAEAEEHADAVALQGADLRDELLLAVECSDSLHRRHEWFGAALLDGGLVHAGSVIVSNLRLDCSVLAGRLGLLQNVAQHIEIALAQAVIAAPARLCPRDGIVFIQLPQEYW